MAGSEQWPHDGQVDGVRTIDSGMAGLAYAASEDRADLDRLHAAGLCETPSVGGSIPWVAPLTATGLLRVEALSA